MPQILINDFHTEYQAQETAKQIFESSHPRSPKWPAFEKRIIEAHPFCSFCGQIESKVKLVGHHIQPYHLHPDLELEESNILVVGETCTTGNHHLLLCHYGNWSKWNPDARHLAELFLKNIQEKVSDFKPVPLFPFALGTI